MDLERYGERGIIASIYVLGATVEQLRQSITANRGALELRAQSPYAKWDNEGWIYDHGEGRLSFELHQRNFGWLHEIAMHIAQRGHEALVIDGESFYSPDGFRAFTVHAPGVAPKTWWIDPIRGLNSPESELDDLLLKFKGDGNIAKDEISESGGARGQRRTMELLVRLSKDRQPLWPPEFLTPEQDAAERERLYGRDAVLARLREEERAREPVAPPPPQRSIGGLLVLLTLAPSAIAAPWFWSSLGHVEDLQGALIASAFSALSVGWLGLLPFGWVPLKFRLAWFIGLSALIPFLWVLA